jgi:hypothetical protein
VVESSRMLWSELYTAEYYDGQDPVLPSTIEFKDLANFYKCKNCMLCVPVKVKVLNCERLTIIGVLEIKRTVVYMTRDCHSITVDKRDNFQINVNEQ